MPHPIDASVKHLVTERLADWLPLSGRRADGPLEVIDADLSTVTAYADKVLRVGSDPPWLLHLELQAYRDPAMASRLHFYNSLLEYRHEAPVWSVVVLLCRSADHASLTGLFTLPLAPLSDLREDDLPGVVRRMDARISAEASKDKQGALWTATGILMGMRYAPTLVADLLQGVSGMEESTFYQYIMAKGAVKEAQKLLLRLARARFGPLTPQAEAAIAAIADVDRLEQLSERVLFVSSWDELLAAS
jgi:hypothetical protein